MQEHTMTLREDEFQLVQRIRKMNGSTHVKKKLMDQLIKDIEDFLSLRSPEEIQWLQVGKPPCFPSFEPVKPEDGAPLASQIIIDQRRQGV